MKRESLSSRVSGECNAAGAEDWWMPILMSAGIIGGKRGDMKEEPTSFCGESWAVDRRIGGPPGRE